MSRSRTPVARVTRAVVAALALVVLAGCTVSGASAVPTSRVGATPSASGTGSSPASPGNPSGGPSRAPSGAVSTAGATASPPTTTSTAWGRIWDALPARFPSPPGAEPSPASEGPASAVLSVGGKPGPVVAYYRGALIKAGYDIEALAGPMEDGGTTIDAVGRDPECRVQVSAVPRGGTTLVTVLFAAACPFR